MTSISRAVTLALLSPALFLGCGDKKGDSASIDTLSATDTASMADAGGDTAATSAAPSTNAQSNDPSSQPVTAADIERWQKGMAGERQAVQQTAAKMKTAKTSEDKLNLMMELQEQSTAAAGAQAAGLDEERYKFVRSKLSDVVKYLVPPEIPGMDTAQLPQSQRDRLRAEREDYLKQTEWAVPPAVVEALKPRAAELRKQDLELAFARAGAIQ